MGDEKKTKEEYILLHDPIPFLFGPCVLLAHVVQSASVVHSKHPALELQAEVQWDKSTRTRNTNCYYS